MDIVCQTHPNHSAVEVCDRCARTLCDQCAVGVGASAARCGSCALVGAGVRCRESRPAASRRTVRSLRRALLDARASGAADESPAPTGAPAGSDRTVDGWWSDEGPSGWTRRF